VIFFPIPPHRGDFTYKKRPCRVCAEVGARNNLRLGEMVPDGDPKKENLQIAKARRKIVSNYRALANDGIDPFAGKQEIKSIEEADL
jgi:hypothetical protein